MLENVLSAVNVLAVYVLGIVVDEWMKALVVSFRYVEFRVSAPPEFVRPVPSSDVNVEPFSIRFVVLAVVNDPYVVDEYANVCSAVHELGFVRLSPTVLAVPPLYAPENVSVLSVAVRLAKLEPNATPLIVEFVRPALSRVPDRDGVNV